MSKIENKNSVEKTIKDLISEGSITENDEPKILKKISDLLSNSEISKFFDDNSSVKIESEIIAEDGMSYRPDRIFITKNSTVVIDYKTGSPSKKHKEQIEKYANLLREMGYKNIQKRLVYIESLEIVEV